MYLARGNFTRGAALAGVALLLALLGAAGSPATASDQAQTPGPPRLDSRLARVADAFEARGPAAAGELARSFDIDVEDGAVRAVIEARPGLSQRAAATARGLGAAIEGSYQDLVQALVPFGSLKPLARAGAVQFVRPPLRVVPMVTSEGVELINADDWHTQGVTGAGVKVAVLDLGFESYEDLLGSELPETVTARSFRADGEIGGGTPHGTGVAEVVHDVAPDADLYLVNFETEVELANASQWLTDEGIDTINASWGFFTSGPGDGTGVVNDVVSTSTAAGTMWSVAAANHAQRHWSGTFLDTDGDLFHEFQNTPFQDEGNEVQGAFGFVFAGEEIGGELKWDDAFDDALNETCQDYDLYLKRTDDNTGEPITVASSTNVQNDGSGCVAGADPIESIVHTVEVSDIYHLVVKKSISDRDAFLHLYSFFHDIEYRVSANSLGQPADNADAVAVGAVPWSSPDTIELYSSRGPTSDGRIKPDLVGPDGVSNATFPFGFAGTSAAAPHIAGAAALVGQPLTCFTPGQMKAYLEGSVVDLGDSGKDNTFGSGRLLLGALPTDTDADGLGDECDDDDDNDGWTDAAEEFIGTNPQITCTPGGWPPDPAPAPDGNGAIQINDATFVASRFGQSSGDADYTPRAELASQDGVIQIDDVTALVSRFGDTC